MRTHVPERAPLDAMTARIKSGITRAASSQPCCRKAEISTILRIGGGLRGVGSRVVVEAEFDTSAAARRVQSNLHELYGHKSQVFAVPDEPRTRYVVRVASAAEALARQTGLVDINGWRVRGLSPQIVAGAGCDAVAAWRGAFLTSGSLTRRGRVELVQVVCPGPEVALALVGVARRQGIQAKAREVRDVDLVEVREDEAIAKLLTVLGTHEALLAWQERQRRRTPASTLRISNFDSANLAKAAEAGTAAAARARRALDILGDDVPDHLRAAGIVRIEHNTASLDDLGKQHDPPLTKDAIAGRIRRLLELADKRAREKGVPGIEDALEHEALPVSA